LKNLDPARTVSLLQTPKFPGSALICRVNGLRTARSNRRSLPAITCPKAERKCEFRLVGDEVKIDCQVLTAALTASVPAIS
jgi:hypothetical protein